MAEERMDLEAAGELLGLHPNSVRARAKRGKIRYEADNTGKIWVWLDPDKAANDRGSMKPSKPPIEPKINPPIQELVTAFEGHIETLKAENFTLQTTVADLRTRLDASEGERRRLVEELLAKAPPPPPPEPAAAPPPAAPERPRGFFRWLRKGKG